MIHPYCFRSCYPLYFGCYQYWHQFLRTWSISQELQGRPVPFLCVICKFEHFFAPTSHFPSNGWNAWCVFDYLGFSWIHTESMCISGCRSLWRRWKTSLQSPPASRFIKERGLGPFGLISEMTRSPKDRFSIHLFSIKFSTVGVLPQLALHKTHTLVANVIWLASFKHPALFFLRLWPSQCFPC